MCVTEPRVHIRLSRLNYRWNISTRSRSTPARQFRSVNRFHGGRGDLNPSALQETEDFRSYFGLTPRRAPNAAPRIIVCYQRVQFRCSPVFRRTALHDISVQNGARDLSARRFPLAPHKMAGPRTHSGNRPAYRATLARLLLVFGRRAGTQTRTANTTSTVTFAARS